MTMFKIFPYETRMLIYVNAPLEYCNSLNYTIVDKNLINRFVS